MAPPKRILDSHIHLWPHSAANNTGHAWMEPHAHLSKQYSLTDYQESVNFKPIKSSMSAPSSPTNSTSSTIVQPTGIVYVETDRRIGDSSIGSVINWASEPLEEVKFMRRVVEGTVTEDEKSGFGGGRGSVIKGIVFWAPFNQGVSVLEEYLAEAEKLAGKETWRRVKGFRYLLQGIKDEEEFRKLALSDSWIECLRALRSKGRNYSFDVGVDMRSGGVWQLEAAVEMIEKCNQGLAPDKQVTFILNHLLKPDLISQLGILGRRGPFDTWTSCIERFSKMPNVYMKLSGAFSEMEPQKQRSPLPALHILEPLSPWLDVLFASFPPECIMFGSDWPVCNVRGPGDQKSWNLWRAVVELALDRYKLSDEARDRIWYGTAVEAYHLDVSVGTMTGELWKGNVLGAGWQAYQNLATMADQEINVLH